MVKPLFFFFSFSSALMVIILKEIKRIRGQTAPQKKDTEDRKKPEKTNYMYGREIKGKKENHARLGSRENSRSPLRLFVTFMSEWKR